MQEIGPSEGSCTSTRQEPDTQTMELLRLTEKYPVLILTLLVNTPKQHLQQWKNTCIFNINIFWNSYLSFWLQDMVCNKETAVAGRALGVLEAILSHQKGYEADFCINLRSALIQVLQRLTLENADGDLGQGHNAQGMCETTYWG